MVSPSMAEPPVLQYEALSGNYFATRFIGGVSSVDGSAATTSNEFEVRHRADVVSVLSLAYGHGWAGRGWPIRGEIEFQRRVRFDYDSRVYSSPTIGYETNLRSYGLMFNGFYDMEMPLNSSGYVGAGIGYVRNVADVEREVLGTSIANYWSYTTNNLSWSFMAGVITRLTDKLRFEIGYRYTDLGRFDQGTDLGGVAINGKSYISHDLVLGFMVNF